MDHAQKTNAEIINDLVAENSHLRDELSKERQEVSELHHYADLAWNLHFSVRCLSGISAMLFHFALPQMTHLRFDLLGIVGLFILSIILSQFIYWGCLLNFSDSLNPDIVKHHSFVSQIIVMVLFFIIILILRDIHIPEI